jgi:hypothetical protein
VEVDAIEPRTLRALVRDAIESHIDPRVLEATRRIEEQERRTLELFVKRVGKSITMRGEKGE